MQSMTLDGRTEQSQAAAVGAASASPDCGIRTPKGDSPNVPRAGKAEAWQAERTLTMLLDLGRAMLECGADVNLVEGWISRLGRAYGAAHMNSFVITSSIVVTMQMPAGENLTQTRRIMGSATDFMKLELLNRLALKSERELTDPEKVQERVRELDAKRVPRQYLYLGGFLAAGGFAIFFGGTMVDGLVSALFGLVICLMMDFLRPFMPNTIAFNFVASFIPGLGIASLCALAPGLGQSFIMMGDVMILIPGIAITNSLRDMLAGDTIAGLLRLAESLLWATAMALGFMAAMMVVGAIA